MSEHRRLRHPRAGRSVAATGLVACALLCPAGSAAQRQGAASAGSASSRRIVFETDEGTFTNVDVSPDGRTLVFDLLGDIYTLPIEGGQARPLLSGPHWDRTPRFSPDGRRISFLSDRDGEATCVWVANRDGSNARAVVAPFAGNDRPGCGARGASGTPEWTADGAFVSFATSDTLYDNVRVYVARVEDGAVERLDNLPPTLRTPAREIRLVATSATFAPDGRRAYLSETGRSVCYARLQECGFIPPRTWLYEVDRRTKTRRLITDTLAGWNEFKPQLSRSGRYMAYLRRESNGVTMLRVRRLGTGDDRPLTTIRDAVDPYRWGDRGDEVPAYAFTPDDRFIIISIAGKLRRVAVATGNESIIPFKVHVERDVRPNVRASFRLNDGPMPIRAVRWPTLSRDGRVLVFSAVGYLWRRDLETGETKRITGGEGQFEYMPALSPDGHSVAYVEFPRGGSAGRLMVTSLRNGTQAAVLEASTTYYLPAWSPDSKRLAFLQAIVGQRGDTTGRYGWVDLATRTAHVVMPAAMPGRELTYSQLVSFTSDGQRLLMTDARLWQPVQLVSANLDGSDRRTLATGSREIRGIVPAPDLSRILMIDGRGDAWVRPFRVDTAPLSLSLTDSLVRRIRTNGVAFPHWQSSDVFTYGFANIVSRYRVGDAAGTPLDTVDLRVARREPRGALAFRNVRVVTISGGTGAGRVIDRGTVVVRGRRIVAVGPVDSTSIPSDAAVVDATGMSIIPGLVDVHYHSVGRHAGMTPFAAHGLGDSTAIAYGVTTGWDAVNHGTEMSLALAELRDAGRVIGPRWFTAGSGVSPSPVLPIESAEDARTIVERNRTMGVELLKDYSTASRRIRRWLVDAAREQGVAITTHASINGGINDVLVRAAEGYTAVEHMYVTVPFYRDVRRFLAETGLIYTPNLLISDGTSTESWSAAPPMFAEIRARSPVHASKLDRFTAAFLRGQIANGRLTEQGAIRHASTDAATPYYELTSRAMASLARDGGIVALGAHNDPAVLTHLEMWLLNRGGLPAGDVIRAATMAGAIKLGYARDIGSIEAGKIADMLVLTGNPLTDIRHTVDIRYTVADGIVYDATTLRELPLDQISAGSVATQGSRVSIRADSLARLVDGLSPSTRAAALSYVNAPDTAALRALATVRADPAALRFVAAMLTREQSPMLRRSLVGILQSADSSFVREARAALQDRVGNDPDSMVVTAAIRSLRVLAYRETQLGSLLAARIKRARAEGDTALLPLLLEEEEGLAHAERNVHAPAFMRTPPAAFAVKTRPNAPVRVIAFGDYGTAHRPSMRSHQADLAAVIRAHHAASPFTFGITTGDNFYPSAFPSPTDSGWVTAWERQYGQLGIPFYISLGNHDWAEPAGPLSENLYSVASRTWRFPAFYYTYTAGPAQFFAVNTNALTERQLTWLRAELAKSTARWKIVYGHFPVVEQTNYSIERPQQLLLPILKQYNVDMYLAGHHHSMQHWHVDGIDYVVTGAGGAQTYGFGDTTRTVVGRRFIASRPGFADVEISDRSLTLRFVGIGDVRPVDNGQRIQARSGAPVVLYEYKRQK